MTTLNYALAVVLGASAFVVFRRGHKVVVQDWRSAVLWFMLGCVLLTIGGYALRASNQFPPDW